MIKKQDKPDYWCKGLYLKAGKYMIGDSGIELHKDKPVSFISSSIFKVEGIPAVFRRILLKDNVEEFKHTNTKDPLIVDLEPANENKKS